MEGKIIVFLLIFVLAILQNIFANSYVLLFKKTNGNCFAELLDNFNTSYKPISLSPYKICVDNKCLNVLLEEPPLPNLTWYTYIPIDFYPKHNVSLYFGNLKICSTEIIDCTTNNMCNSLCDYDPDCLLREKEEIINITGGIEIESYFRKIDIRFSMIVGLIIFISGLIIYKFKSWM